MSKLNRWKKIYSENVNQKKAATVILILGKVYLKEEALLEIKRNAL